jgi:hypothetical protein
MATTLTLYMRDGCHLCDETRRLLVALLNERRAAGLAAPELIEHDIATDAALERAYFATVPVVELGTERVELATSVVRLRRLLRRLDDLPAVLD